MSTVKPPGQHSDAWKRHETKTARILGGRRVPGSGAYNYHTTGDVEHASLYIECKYRKEMAVFSMFRRAAQNAKVEGKLPVLVLKEANHQGALVVITLELFAQICLHHEIDNGG